MRYKNSGSLGDLIYSLSVIPKMGSGDFLIPLNNLANVAQQYGYSVSAMDKQHLGCITEEHYSMLAPLLERQPYLTSVSTCSSDVSDVIDLDKFRSILFRSFNGNYVEAFHKTFNLQFHEDDLKMPWLQVDKKPNPYPFVVCRTSRYHGHEPRASLIHRQLAEVNQFDKYALFVGNPDEHKDYERTVGMKIEYHTVRDFLELAEIINAAKCFVGNQTFAYSLAVALGKSAVLETWKIKSLQQNECYFPRYNITYF